ncbi:hypothetical protein ABT160_42180 [Streptomyces sp. NPDC001941]|uniref:hypothetical protein n=1 Tax=Streptomyces sp. NPDC001941 TaxID=3154659 RepID=UPI003332CB58
MSTTAMTAAATPIYESLVHERGDALAETRRAAEQTHTEAREALDWSAVRNTEREPDSRTPSGGFQGPTDLFQGPTDLTDATDRNEVEAEGAGAGPGSEQ